MKKLLFMLTSLFLMGASTYAQDTLRQRDQTKTQTQQRDRIHQEEHLMFQDGRLYRWQNGVRSEVQSQVQLRKGGVANPDGTYQLQNQERMQLRNGECLDMDGNRYQNQRRFNQRHMMTQREIQRSQNKIMQKQQKKTNKQARKSGTGS